MKNIINKTSVLLFAMITLTFNACVDPVDLITSDVNTGGLVDPLVSNFPYKLGATTSIDLGVSIPEGPAIQSLEINKVFETADGDMSNEVLMSTVEVGGANASGAIETSFTMTYADLKSGLTVNGSPLPDDELDLTIGDSWTLSYTAVMSDDSRKVVNNASTNIGVANQYAGDYNVTGTFNHPSSGIRAIGEKKFLTPIDAYTCLTYAGDLGGYGTDYEIYIVVNPADNSVTVKGTDNTVTDIIMDGVNKYDPATGVFTLNYYYVGGNGNRIMSEVYTPL